MIKSMIGRKFGYFEVISFSEKRRDKFNKVRRFWKCVCRCGNLRYFSTSHINAKSQISCGCYQQKYWTAPRDNKQLTKHGFAREGKNHPLYRVWRNIKSRCLNKNNGDYKYYGAKGVSIFSEWLNDFKSFYDWAVSSDWKKGLTIDRVNNKGNYEPSNCRFIPRSENSRKVSLDNHGFNFGSKCHFSKLNEQQVIEIKKMINSGVMLKDIAKIYNTPPNSISNIKTGKTWKHVIVDIEPE